MTFGTAFGSGRRRGESAVDRLIELASDEKTSNHAPSTSKEIERAPQEFVANYTPEAENLEENPMWKMLLQFKGVLPYVARLLPLLDVGAGHQQTAALSTEVKQSVGELQSAHREMRLAVQDQTLQLKRFEEQVVRMREATEKNAFEHSELVEDVKSIQGLVKTVTAILGGLILVLIIMVGFLMAHISHR